MPRKKKEAAPSPAPAKAVKKTKKVKLDDLGTNSLLNLGKGENKQARARAVMAKINSQHKKVVIATADQVPNTYYLRRPSGIYDLDEQCAGGLPAGSVAYISGPEGAGKSYLLMEYFINQQRIHGENTALALCPRESKLDYFDLRRRGLVIAIPTGNIEERNQWRAQNGLPTFTKDEVNAFRRQIGTIHLFNGETGEEVLDTLLDLLRENVYDIIAVDSLTSLLPKSEITAQDKGGFEQVGQQGAQATLQNRFYLHYYGIAGNLTNPNLTNIIFTNQVRANRKKSEAPGYISKYLPDWSPAGGYAGRHAKMVDICVQSGGRITEGADKRVVGKTFEWEIIKGKAGIHENLYGEAPFYYGRGVNRHGTLFVAALAKRFIVDADERNYYKWVHPETGEQPGDLPDKFTRSEFEDLIEFNVDLDLHLRDLLLSHSKIECRYR